jgi:hypothetical protein
LRDEDNDSNDETLSIALKDKKRNIGEFKRYSTLQADKVNERSMVVWTTFHAKEEEKYWVIGIGCSNHMTSDKRRLISLKKVYNEVFNFGDDESI